MHVTSYWNSFMKLYERLGWTGPERDMAQTLANSLGFVEAADAAPDRIDLIPFNRADVARTRCSVAMVYYLLGDHPRVTRFAREALERGLEYFFGSWRSEVPTREGTRDPGWWKAHLDWADVFRELVLWGEYLGDQESLARLARFPDTKCSMNAAEYSRADFAFFLALAAVLRGDGAAECSGELERAARARKKKTAAAAAALAQLVTPSPAAFQDALDALLAVHHKSRSNGYFTELVSVEGSILYHLASDRGLDPTVADRHKDYVVQRPKGSLERPDWKE
jgi:hypothetical protein